jgi:hypothetical protein
MSKTNVKASEANLKMKDLFEVGNAKTPSEGSNGTTRPELEASKAVAALKEEVAKKSKLIRWSVVEDVLVDKTVEVLDIPVLTFLLPAWQKCRESAQVSFEMTKWRSDAICRLPLLRCQVSSADSSKHTIRETFRRFGKSLRWPLRTIDFCGYIPSLTGMVE